MRPSLAALALVLACTRAYAWEAYASAVPDRLVELHSFAAAPRESMPGWARRIRASEDRVHWSEDFRGKTYVFGVGMARGAGILGARLDAAEDRARESVVERAGEFQTSTATASDGTVIKVKVAVVNGARILDWYLAPSGELYALAVLAD